MFNIVLYLKKKSTIQYMVLCMKILETCIGLKPRRFLALSVQKHDYTTQI